MIAPRIVAVSMVLDNGDVQITEVARYHRNKTDQFNPCSTESPQFASMLIEGAEIEQAITNFSIDGLHLSWALTYTTTPLPTEFTRMHW